LALLPATAGLLSPAQIGCSGWRRPRNFAVESCRRPPALSHYFELSTADMTSPRFRRRPCYSYRRSMGGNVALGTPRPENRSSTAPSASLAQAHSQTPTEASLPSLRQREVIQVFFDIASARKPLGNRCVYRCYNSLAFRANGASSASADTDTVGFAVVTRTTGKLIAKIRRFPVGGVGGLTSPPTASR